MQVQQLLDMGIEPAVTFWPVVTPAGSWFYEFNSSGYFVRNLSSGAETSLEWNQFLVDQTSATVQAAVYQAFKLGYGQYGFRTVWLDAVSCRLLLQSVRVCILHMRTCACMHSNS